MFKRKKIVDAVEKLNTKSLKLILKNDLCFEIDVLDEDISKEDYGVLYEDLKKVLIGELPIDVFYEDWWGEDLEDFTFAQLYKALERILKEKKC